MRYRTLGRTGLRISEIGHGLWGMGSWSGSSPEQDLRALRRSIELGCTFFDSALAYGKGKADSLLGHVIPSYDRQKLILASKVPPKNWKWPADPTDHIEDVYPKQHVLDSAYEIRRLLGVEQIDLLQLHVWDDAWVAADGWKEAAVDLKKNGVINAFGLSLNRWEPYNGIKALGTGIIDAVQVIYNVFDQAPEDELFPLCRKLNIGVIARVPLDEGSLGGKLTPQTRFPNYDWRSKYFGPENLPATVSRVERLKEIVPQNSTLAQMALRFVLSNTTVSTVIVGMRSFEHVEENIDVSNMEQLPDSLLAELKRHRWDRQVTPWAN